MAYAPQRYSRVAWLTQSDLDEGRKCAWEYERAGEKIACWPVSLYGQRSSQAAFLLIHAQKGNGNDGGLIALACSDVPHFDWYAQWSMGVPVQSGPQRHRYRIDADFWREENP